MVNNQKKYSLLSYIIPSYNAVSFLEETVESIFKQNLDIPFEVIISDDCSTDGTQELIKKMSTKHSEIKFFLNKKNRYAPANRNFAISQSKGDLIYMLDHDNVLEQNSVQKLINAIINRGLDAASVAEVYFFKNNLDNYRGSKYYKFNENLFTIQDFITSLYSPAHSNNYMYTRTAYNTTHGYPNRGARENLGFGMRLVANGFPIAIVPGTKYYHRILDSGMWWDEQKKNPQLGHKNMIIIFKEFIDLFDEQSQKKITGQNSINEADFYIGKCMLKLSKKGWVISRGRK